jgi:hypothetical protein
MDSKNPPLNKWFDPGPQDEPPDIAGMMDELGYRDIMPKEKEEADDKTMG